MDGCCPPQPPTPQASVQAPAAYRGGFRFWRQRKSLIERSARFPIGLQLITLDVSSDRDIESAFGTLVQRGAGALLVGIGAYLASKRESIITLASRYAIPAIYPLREEVMAGGLMSYGPSQSNAYHQAGIYVGRILKGEKPADLPVMQSTKFEFVGEGRMTDRRRRLLDQGKKA